MATVSIKRQSSGHYNVFIGQERAATISRNDDGTWSGRLSQGESMGREYTRASHFSLAKEITRSLPWDRLGYSSILATDAGAGDKTPGGLPLMRIVGSTTAIAALALILTSPAHAATPTFQHPVHPPAAYLAGCAITSYDDGSRLAECPEDGAVLVWDGDGQHWVNEAGAPIRAAGWYVLE